MASERRGGSQVPAARLVTSVCWEVHLEWTPDRVARIFGYRPKTFEHWRVHALVLTIFDTGCRITELLTASVTDFDLDNLLLTVYGKGRKERRMSFDLRKILFRFGQVKERAEVRSPLMFPSRDGGRWHQRNALRSHYCLTKRLGLPRSGFHRLRHTFATQYLRSGGEAVRLAYGVLERQVLDGPGWIRTERFSVTATSTDVPRDQALRMLQTLLADRFKLRVRQETREMPILELRLARSDGRVGPNLYDCSKPQDGPQEKSFAAPTGGSVVSSDCRAGLSYVVDLASRELDPIVVDKTGLTGQWWFNIFFTEAIGPVDAPANTPTFTGALTEQLGLKTERTRALTPVLVIESVERPTPN